MQILVTGGSGLVGRAAVDALLARGHSIRLLSRHAERDVRRWDGRRVEPFTGDVADPASLQGAAAGCDTLLHLVGIVEEHPPTVTFDAVNVAGTANILAEAAGAGVSRAVYVSSLGADVGTSGYHRSKLGGELETRRWGGDWRICRPGNVYGPGDEVISMLMTLVRTLPAMPVIGDGSQRLQPVWHEDVGEALAAAVERDDLAGQVLELAGVEVTTLKRLLERIEEVTDRHPPHLPIPGALATLGSRFLSSVGIRLPVNEDQLVMLDEENVVRAPEGNALPRLLDRAPTTLDAGLRRLADELPPQLPGDGVGEMLRKRFWVDIRGAKSSPERLLAHFRKRFADITPSHVEVGSEPDTPEEIRWGTTLTLTLPLRGHVQVRVIEVRPNAVTMVTLVGHPLAGCVRFLSEARGEVVRFEVQTYDRAANAFDWLALHPVGNRLQDFTWKRTLRQVVEDSGGEGEVERDVARLDEAEMQAVQEWLARAVESQDAPEPPPPSKSSSSARTVQ